MTQATTHGTQTMNPDTYVAESPFATEQAEFASSLADITSQIVGEFDAEVGDEDSEAAGPDASPPDHTRADTVDQEVETEGESHEEDGDDPGVARGMDRLVAREVKLQAMERTLQERESRVRDLEAQATKYKGFIPVEEMRAKAAHSPKEVIEALGQDPTTFIRLALAESLGDKAPAELKEFAKEAAHNRRIAALESQLQAKQRNEDQATFFRAIDLGAREYVKTVGEKEMPTLAALYKAAPEKAHSEIMEEIARDARARAAQEPDGEPLTYTEAARRVEGRLAEMRKYFAPDMSATTLKKTEAKRTTPPLSAPKPAREAPPWQRQDDLMEAGLKEAMREFHVHEAAARSKRKA